jgi:GNAT superfamily N-acetyltransferase
MRAITVRRAEPRDRAFILSLAPRLTEFGPPAWRDTAAMHATDRDVWEAALDSSSDGVAVFVAEDPEGRALGFIHLQAGHDYYQHDAHAHIADVIVAPDADGQGVGRLLVATAEAWARERGACWMTLNVFAGNQRARDLYARLGFGEDMIKYVKVLA